jgi:cyclase
MLKKRIRPCLDIVNGRTVKGVNFVNLKDAGDPVELAKIYAGKGAGELVALDITATIEKRKTFAGLVERIASAISIPLAVGGGIGSVEDAERLIDAGAGKVSVNTAAFRRPELISEIASKLGSSRLVVAIDAQSTESGWKVVVDGGMTITQKDVIEWTMEAVKLGAGEILLTSMEADGTKAGFSTGITAQACIGAGNIPVIASGGAGTMEHFRDVFIETGCDAALAAGIFHSGQVDIQEVKDYLRSNKIDV